jgi:thioesterase domain-containing protein
MPDVSEEFVKLVETGIDFIRRMGLKVVEMRRGYVELKAPLDRNRSHVGTMYAGALFSLAEVPGGALYLSSFDVSRYYPIVKEMTIRYKKPVVTDATVKVEMSEEEMQRVAREADEKGKSEFRLRAEVFDEAGQLVCESTGTYQLRKMGT